MELKIFYFFKEFDTLYEKEFFGLIDNCTEYNICKNYMSAGSLSRYILWGEPTLRASIQKYKEKFNLQ